MKVSALAIILPCKEENKGVVWLNSNTIKPTIETYKNPLSNWWGHNIYIILPEFEKEIESSDWVFDIFAENNTVWQVKQGDIDNPKNLDYCRKIIATSEKRLNLNSNIPESFIKEFATKYNERAGMTPIEIEVEVEYERCHFDNEGVATVWYEPLVNQNGDINIKIK